MKIRTPVKSCAVGKELAAIPENSALFLDANVLFSAAYRPNAGLLRLWKLKKITLISSRHVLEEARINLTDEVQRGRLTRLCRSIEFFDAPSSDLPQGVSLPDKDAPIVLAAVEGKALRLTVQVESPRRSIKYHFHFALSTGQQCFGDTRK